MRLQLAGIDAKLWSRNRTVKVCELTGTRRLRWAPLRDKVLLGHTFFCDHRMFIS